MRSGRWVWFAAVFAWVPLIFSCTIRLTEPHRLPEAVRIHRVGPYLQEPEQCGPFALAALLENIGIKADLDQLVQKLYSPGAGGTLTMDLFLEARRRGLETRQLEGSEEILVKELRDHGPAIVLFKYHGLSGSAGHFILVTGYSSDPYGFFLLWGDGKLSWMKLDRFDKFWSESGFWMLTVHREG
ncbi:MAG: cysteine peptidase family C39 domain-containing protein [bacterium]|nr:cysteine peptidase family C39 domain-containing protein [bacterium]MDT8365330.1 cysteine peptidase family C39 domain-containing protein [bacterium]